MKDPRACVTRLRWSKAFARVPRGARSVLFAAAVLSISATAAAGSYLDRAVLILRQATDEADFLRSRTSNRDLAEMVHSLAAARLQAVRETAVPHEVEQAHPHLLLVLENYERAASAAMDGQAARFISYQNRARDEETVLRGIMKQLGWPLPRGGH